MLWQIERFDKSRHVRSGFDCGKLTFTDFIQKFASQYEKRNVGRTYVAVRPGETQVLGYYTLATGELQLDDLPETASKNLPRHPVPVVLLARLAVDATVQGQGLGAALLRDAIQRVLQVSEQVGIHAIIVDAIDDDAVRFYSKYGFIALPEQQLKLFLPLATAANALA